MADEPQAHQRMKITIFHICIAVLDNHFAANINQKLNLEQVLQNARLR